MNNVQVRQAEENRFMCAALKTIADGDKIGRRTGELLIGMGLAEFSKFGVKLTHRGYRVLDELEAFKTLTKKDMADTCIALRT